MKTIKRMADALASCGAAIASWLKVPLMSRCPSPKGKRSQDEKLVILGNGPSLTQTLEAESDKLKSKTLLAVNFAANAPVFFELKPTLYVLADPHFFEGEATDPNVARLWQNIGKADWPLTLYVPCVKVKPVAQRLPRCTVKGFNLTPGEGAAAIVYPLYNAGLAMPRPRNVLIPSIMIGIREGFKTIYIAGADHTWSKTLEVDEENRVVSVQPHFYKDNADEKARVTSTYTAYRLHDILKSLYTAFRSYHHIQAWARKKGVKIINITPGSFIDAFPRMKHLP